MSLEGLLAFAGILAAIYAIVDPVQRRSIRMFVPAWTLWIGGSVSLLLILLAQAAEVPCSVFLPVLSAFFCRFAFGESPLAVFGLSTASFLVPVVMLWIAAAKWRSARLSSADSEALADVLSIAMLEGRFGEAARLLERNRERLPLLSRRVCRALFDPALIAPMFGSGSFIHLGLLADSAALEDSECDRFQIVDSVVRGLVRCERSPLRSAVIDAFRGHEFHEYPPDDAAIIDATFKNPGSRS